MRIGIDARFYGPRIGGGGIGRYVSELITNLQKTNTQHEYFLFLNKNNINECKVTNSRFHKVLVDLPWYSLAEQIKMPRIIKDSKVDLMHYPHWNIPIFSQVPFIVTIHDLILLEDSKSARSSTKSKIIHGFKYAGFRTVLEHAVKNSKKIVTISKYSKSSIMNYFHVDKKKIEVVYNGFTPLIAEKNIELYKLGVYEPYFLYVGNAYPHKNLNTLIHAFAQFSKEYQHVQLVIAGRRDVFSKGLEKEARSLNIRTDQIRFIDLPTDDELARLYEGANLLIHPAKIEGFGIPPLESLYYRTPVAVAHSSSLPEVVQEFGNYFDPYDIEKIIEYMEIAVENKEALLKNVNKLDDHLNNFSWLENAKKIEEIYTQTNIK